MKHKEPVVALDEVEVKGEEVVDGVGEEEDEDVGEMDCTCHIMDILMLI